MLLRNAPLIVTALICAAPAPAQFDAPKVAPIRTQEVLAGKAVSLVLVKDFIPIHNTGPLARVAEFERYTPIIDDEQFVAGRWLTAQTEGGTRIPVDIAAVNADPSGNLIQTIRLRPLPPGQRITITATTLVARRERPLPAGNFPIPRPEDYPEAVRDFLRPTPMVVTNHKIVKDLAAQVRETCEGDALKIAGELVRLADGRTYLPSGPMTGGLPLSAGVIKHGGTCCASAVAACAVLRELGIPAQLTYCPAGYVHGVTRFYLKGYGWVRMDTTSGGGAFPLVRDEASLGLVRIFDTPIRMERLEYAYAWPYQHNDIDGPLEFRADGKPTGAIRMYDDGTGALPWVMAPFPHLEPGSFNAVLGTERLEGPWGDWEALVKASRTAATTTATGPFNDLLERLPALAPYVKAASSWAMPEADPVAD